MTPTPIPVAILGATGAVGQKLVSRLARHPWFKVASLAASDRSAGKPYREAVHWLEPDPIPEAIAGEMVRPCEPGLPGVIAFSALDATAAETIEPAFAAQGYFVVTNTRSFRMEPDVPLLVPDVNPDALQLLAKQHANRRWSGAIVANPNCSTAALVVALAPLHRAFGVERVFVATMQAASGAGYPGVPSLDLLGNVIPYIGGEEEKIEAETQKILDTTVAISAHANRVAVVDGHTESVSVGLKRRATVDEALSAFREYRAPGDVATLPSAPNPPIVVHDACDRPQPRLDAMLGAGMAVSVGRVRPCPLLDLRFTVLGHNVIRGAAGAAIVNAELLVARGLVRRTA